MKLTTLINMKTRFVSIVAIIALILISSACRKYEEGPLLNLRSPQKKLVGLWEVVEFKINSIDHITTYKDSINANFLIADYDGLYVSIVRNSSISSQLASSTLIMENKNKNMLLNFNAQQSYSISYLIREIPVLFEENSWEIIKLSSTEFKIRILKQDLYSFRFKTITE